MNGLEVLTLVLVLVALGVSIAVLIKSKDCAEKYGVPIYDANAGIGDTGSQGCSGHHGKCEQIIKCDGDDEC